MEEKIISIAPDYKLYKDGAVYLGTFLGGPIVAGYMAAENFKKLGQPSGARTSWILSILVSLLLIGLAFMIPNIEKMPSYLLPILDGFLAQLLIQKYLGEQIRQHIENGGPVYTVWRAGWIGAVVAAIFLAIIFLILLETNAGVS